MMRMCYGNSVGNTTEENSSISLIQMASCCQQGHAGSKNLLQQNRAILNSGCQLTKVDCIMAMEWLCVFVHDSPITEQPVLH